MDFLDLRTTRWFLCNEKLKYKKKWLHLRNNFARSCVFPLGWLHVANRKLISCNRLTVKEVTENTEKGSRTPTWLKIIANLILMALAGVVLVWLTSMWLDVWTRHGKEAVVPSVKGLDLYTAEERLIEAGFDLFFGKPRVKVGRKPLHLAFGGDMFRLFKLLHQFFAFCFIFACASAFENARSEAPVFRLFFGLLGKNRRVFRGKFRLRFLLFRSYHEAPPYRILIPYYTPRSDKSQKNCVGCEIFPIAGCGIFRKNLQSSGKSCIMRRKITKGSQL